MCNILPEIAVVWVEWKSNLKSAHLQWRIIASRAQIRVKRMPCSVQNYQNVSRPSTQTNPPRLLRGRSKGQTGQKEPDWVLSLRRRTFLGPLQETVSGGQGLERDCVRVVVSTGQGFTGDCEWWTGFRRRLWVWQWETELFIPAPVKWRQGAFQGLASDGKPTINPLLV